MVTIRMARKGAKRSPFYNIVVADHHKPRDGAFLERLGFYNPVAKEGQESVRLDMERVQHWLDQGARPSESVGRLIKQYAKSTAAA